MILAEEDLTTCCMYMIVQDPSLSHVLFVPPPSFPLSPLLPSLPPPSLSLPSLSLSLLFSSSLPPTLLFLFHSPSLSSPPPSLPTSPLPPPSPPLLSTDHRCSASSSTETVGCSGGSQTTPLGRYLGDRAHPQEGQRMSGQQECICEGGREGEREGGREGERKERGREVRNLKEKTAIRNSKSTNMCCHGTHLMEGRCLMTTSSAWMPSKGMPSWSPLSTRSSCSRSTRATALMLT